MPEPAYLKIHLLQCPPAGVRGVTHEPEIPQILSLAGLFAVLPRVPCRTSAPRHGISWRRHRLPLAILADRFAMGVRMLFPRILVGFVGITHRAYRLHRVARSRSPKTMPIGQDRRNARPSRQQSP